MMASGNQHSPPRWLWLMLQKLSVKDVYTFTGVRLPRFATAFPEVARGKQVIGAMIYRLVDDEGKAVAAALDEGLLVLRADGNKKLHQIKSTEEITTPVKKPAAKKTGG